MKKDEKKENVRGLVRPHKAGSKPVATGRDIVFTGTDYTVTSTTDGGDPLLTNVEVIVCFWGSFWSTTPAPSPSSDEYLQAFTGIVTGPYLTRLNQYRGVGPGTMLYHEINDSTDPAAGYSDDDVKNMLVDRIQNHGMPGPEAGHNRFYAVITPLGINNGLSGALGQHQNFTLNGASAVFAWVDLTSSLTDLSGATRVFSHELVEGCTNPLLVGSNPGNGIKAPGNVGGSPVPDGDDEIGDTCNSESAVITINGITCSVQSYWSKEDNSCILPLGSLDFVVDKSTFGKDEVHDTINNAGGLYPSAFWLVLEDFSVNTFNSFGVSVPTPTGSFNGLQGITISPSPATPGGPTPAQAIPVFEDPANPANIQRIRFSFDITFDNSVFNAGTTPFPSSGFLEYQLNAGFVINGSLVQGIHSNTSALFELVAGADPYFTNVDPSNNNYAFLSQDLRVFSAASGDIPLPGATPFTSDGYGSIQSLIGFLNSNTSFTTPGNPDPLNQLPGQGAFGTNDSSVTPTNGSGQPNFNYAIARVRLRDPGPFSSNNVRVFFRLWVAPSYDTDFQPSTTYKSNPAFPALPQNPLPSGAGLPPDPSGAAIQTIPFFATDLNGTHDYDSTNLNANIRPITVAMGQDNTWAYFGCFLDVYNSTIQPQLGGTHHCLVAQIAYDDAPIIPSGNVPITPENSDKLAQRNLQITLSGNPGPASTHRIPQAFDTRPSLPYKDAAGNVLNPPDELMIDWGNTPVGSTVHIYWPQVNSADVLKLASDLYYTRELTATDANTIQTKVTKGITYVPIPEGAGKNFAGLFTVDLPIGVVKGEEFNIVVRRIATTRRRGGNDGNFNNESFAVGKGFRTWRYITGTFQVKIPVTTEEVMLWPEENTLAVLKYRLQQMSPLYRWYPVTQRYIEYVSGRVQGSGGNPGNIPPSITGVPIIQPGKPSEKACLTGKVHEVIYNCFGDFEGFVLNVCCGEQHIFKTCEKGIEEIVLRACRNRLTLTVCVVEKNKKPEICGIIIKCC